MLYRSKPLAVVIGTALAVTLGACGGGSTDANGSQNAAAADPELATLAQVTAKTLTDCSALSPSQRAPLDSNGYITSIAPQCQAAVTTADSPAGAPAFKHNGHPAGYTFYNLFTNPQLTGVTFATPEIMAVYRGDSTTRDRAVFNIKYVDKAGNAGNVITMAQKFPGTSTSARPTNWWITGNQGDYDLGVSTSVTRNQGYSNNPSSGFQTGLDLYINGSTDAPNSNRFDSVLVTGNGLPTTGLWYVRNSASNSFSIATARSSTPQPIANLTKLCNCSTFWVSRTAGVTGAEATTLKANPEPTDNASNWAGTTDGSYNGVQGTKPTKGSVYVFKIYSNGTLVNTETRTLLTDLTAATQAVNLPWNGIGPATTMALDVNNATLNGAQSSLTIDWTQTAAAEKISSIWVSQTDGAYDNATSIATGATSVLATPRPVAGGSTTFTTMLGTPSFDAAPYGGYREVGFWYQMLDGSSKWATYNYYP